MIMEEIFIKNIFSDNFEYDIDIKGLYHYGSIVYGTNTELSDLDYIVICNINVDYLEIKRENIDIQFLSEKYFNKKLNEEHDIAMLECYYQKEPLIKYDIEFNLDKTKLRHSISSISNNSWVKAKQKILLDNEDSYIGFKSLFHSFRILNYAIDIVKDDKINFNKLKTQNLNIKDFFKQIMDKQKTGSSWDDLKNEYKKEHNKVFSEFRKLCPKV